MVTSIIGVSQVTIEQCELFLHDVNPKAPYLANIYKKYCDIYGIKLEIAWVQMCLETNFLRYSDTSITTLDIHNYAGLGALDGNGRKQALKFNTENEGVECHIQHLFAYCSKNNLPQSKKLIDPRFKYVDRGCAINVEDLGSGKWASDKQYANKLLDLLGRLINIKTEKKGDNVMKIAIRRGHQRTGADGCASGIVNEITVAEDYKNRLISKFKALGCQVLDCTPPEANRSLSDSLFYGINKANAWGADIFISCHVNNAYDSYNGAIGCEVLYHRNSSKGQNYATKIERELANLGFKSRGAKADTRGLAEINNTSCPCVVIEPFFCEATSDVATYRKVTGEGIANAIVKGILGKTVNDGDNSSSSSLSKPIEKKEEKKVKNIICYQYGLDENAADYLGDFLNCSTIEAHRPYDYKNVENIFAVGGEKRAYTSYLDTLITGSNEYNTFERTIGYILTKRNIKWNVTKYNITEEEKKAKNKLVIYDNYVDKRAAEYLAYKLNCPLKENKNIDTTKYDFIYLIGSGDIPKGNNVKNIKGQDRYLTAKETIDFMKFI
ncbi:N-acetylmuramoyl-L-alanine amidase [Clostridium botulinum]|uniref:N-acetylmuramoyl-L-alanine amidase n=1 Tax=Clostridium botulinum TaxID=1491 RepID=UPI0021BDF114|nr:N-acetylmuramoyl-L-alanine amidase [Clostridium botulinum]